MAQTPGDSSGAPGTRGSPRPQRCCIQYRLATRRVHGLLRQYTRGLGGAADSASASTEAGAGAPAMVLGRVAGAQGAHPVAGGVLFSWGRDEHSRLGRLRGRQDMGVPLQALAPELELEVRRRGPGRCSARWAGGLDGGTWGWGCGGAGGEWGGGGAGRLLATLGLWVQGLVWKGQHMGEQAPVAWRKRMEGWRRRLG